MPSPRAVVIPFGVPDDGRGLGLGLAALVHSFAQIDGESVALAQLLSSQPTATARAR
ncbi:MAG: domain protein putative component of TonB system, partial [Myxococcaceae bacterium]|nr:domain protein putative component of TonB system [Myxococcaceae bacterium]